MDPKQDTVALRVFEGRTGWWVYAGPDWALSHGDTRDEALAAARAWAEALLDAIELQQEQAKEHI